MNTYLDILGSFDWLNNDTLPIQLVELMRDKEKFYHITKYNCSSGLGGVGLWKLSDNEVSYALLRFLYSEYGYKRNDILALNIDSWGHTIWFDIESGKRLGDTVRVFDFADFAYKSYYYWFDSVRKVQLCKKQKW